MQRMESVSRVQTPAGAVWFQFARMHSRKAWIHVYSHPAVGKEADRYLWQRKFILCFQTKGTCAIWNVKCICRGDLILLILLTEYMSDFSHWGWEFSVDSKYRSGRERQNNGRGFLFSSANRFRPQVREGMFLTPTFFEFYFHQCLRLSKDLINPSVLVFLSIPQQKVLRSIVWYNTIVVVHPHRFKCPNLSN